MTRLPPTPEDAYADSYAEARERFLQAAHRAGAAVQSFVNPHASGPQGEALAMDAAWLGPEDAARVLVMLAGTHGSEGYAASPILLAMLGSPGLEALPQDVGVLLVHAVNPFGFAHTLRTNESNVDLNRNFIDFSVPPPSNPGYLAIHSLLCPADRSEAGMAAARAALEAWIARNGQDAFFNAVFNGQYEVDDGLIFGGRRREWSNLTLEAIARARLSAARRVAFIDWHTGLGGYGEPFFLCFNEAGSPEWERCCRWWGRDAVETRGGFNGAARPRYSGLVFHGMRGFCRQAEFAGAVIEFGTTPPERTIHGLQLDNRLRFDAGLTAGERARLRAEAMDSFCPRDTRWRASVLGEGVKIAEQALAGLCDWTG